MSKPVTVYVGSSPGGMDAESDLVLEFSLRKHASVPVEIVWMRRSNDPASLWSGWPASLWATPFSGFRWAVPELAAKRGLERAVYTDNDVVFLADIAELMAVDMLARPILAREKGRLCVSVWDSAMAQLLPPVELQRRSPTMHERLSREIGRGHIAPLDRAWNCLDGEDLGLEDIKALHFTDMATQPAAALAAERIAERGGRGVSLLPAWHWFEGERRDHRRRDCVALFFAYLAEALEAGYEITRYEPPYR